MHMCVFPEEGKPIEREIQEAEMSSDVSPTGEKIQAG